MTSSQPLRVEKKSSVFTHSQNEIQPKRTEIKQEKLREVADEKAREWKGKQLGKNCGF